MMRFMLQENQQDEILIEREISYLKDYLHIQKLRLAQSDEITVGVKIDETPCPHSIAPMLLIPLSAVERVARRAFHHAEIGRAHVCTPVTNAHPVCRLLFEKKRSTRRQPNNDPQSTP